MSENESRELDDTAVIGNTIVPVGNPDTSFMPAIAPGLARRLIQATGKVQALSLDGEDSFHHYRYTTIAQVRGHANQALSEAGIAIVPRIARTGRSQRTNKDGKTINITVVALDLVICSEDGEYHAAWTGESEDTSDKGVQKAISAGVKSFLAHLLLMPVEEAENDGSRTRSRKSRAKPKPSRASQMYDAAPPTQSTPPAQKPAPHWYDNQHARTRFWAWCREQLALTDSDVLTALNVDDMSIFSGTMLEAKSKIESYVAGKAAPDASPQTDQNSKEV